MPVCTESGTEEPKGEAVEGIPLAAGTPALWDGAGEAGVFVCFPGDGTGEAGSKAGEAEGLLPVGAEKEGSGTGEAESVGNPVVDGAGEKVTAGVPVVAGEEEVFGVSVVAGEEEPIGAPDGDEAAEPAGVPVAEGSGEVVFSGAKETIGGSVGSV